MIAIKVLHINLRFNPIKSFVNLLEHQPIDIRYNQIKVPCAALTRATEKLIENLLRNNHILVNFCSFTRDNTIRLPLRRLFEIIVLIHRYQLTHDVCVCVCGCC